ncbi:MAG: hypothetical protein K940chlam6_00817, partial [Chlamydiae bacterium]|nr:hypothetical protein [Chlamydiota bacterium]
MTPILQGPLGNPASYSKIPENKTLQEEQPPSDTPPRLNYFNFNILPNEILLEIIKNLSPSNFRNLSLVDTRFNSFTTNYFGYVARVWKVPETELPNLYRKIITAARRITDTNKQINLDASVPVMLKLYHMERDTLVVANKIANKLRRDEFFSAEEARNWLNDPENKNQLAQINRLDLALSNLHYLPPELGNLSQLQVLYLQNNQLTSIPNELGNLSQLQRLSLENNQLTSIPNELGNLSQLQRLSLENNQLTSIPNELGNLSQLQWLSLQNNQLTSIPKELGNLSQL